MQAVPKRLCPVPLALGVGRPPTRLTSHSGGRSTYAGGSATTTWPISGCEVKGRRARSSIGTPRIGRNCFGSPGPARTPAPAATTTTPTSGCEAAGELTDVLQPHDFDGRCASPPRRQKHSAKALARGFREAPLHARDGPHFAAQSHLAAKQRVAGHRPVGHARHQRAEDRKIGGRLGE